MRVASEKFPRALAIFVHGRLARQLRADLSYLPARVVAIYLIGISGIFIATRRLVIERITAPARGGRPTYE